MADIKTGVRMTADRVDSLKAPIELDLIALFNELQEDVALLLDKALEEGWSPDVFISRVEGLFDE